MRAGVGRPELARPVAGPLASARTCAKLLVRSANQARHRVSVERKSVQRSHMGRAQNLAALFIVIRRNDRWLEFEQAAFIELAEQDEQIAMAALRFDVVMLEHGGGDRAYGLRGGKPVPDEGADRVEAKVG